MIPRLIEEKMLLLLRQGKISKWFSGIGQEAVSIGAVMALEDDEFILPLHRNLGVFTARDISLEKLFQQFQGKPGGFTKGRDRSFHFGSMDHHIIGMISHLGPQLSLAGGLGLAHKLNKENKVVLAFTGDGGSSEGEFHEALNVASVWDLPVIFLVENNGFSISTPTYEQYAISEFSEKGAAYAIECVQVDGNNILEVYSEVLKWSRNIRRNPRPVMIEAVTFRVRGHEESSGVDYVSKELIEKWQKKDPIKNYESFLLKEKVLDRSEFDDIQKSIKAAINEALDQANKAPVAVPDPQKELDDVYKEYFKVNDINAPGSSKSMRFVDAIRDALEQAMSKHENLILMGQDIAEYGGVFKATEGLLAKFGKERVRNTPLCESAIVGIAFGASIAGMKTVVEMQFADFVSCAFNQIVNNLAKSHYRWGQNADVVVRMPTGAGVGAGPFHSQSTEAWFFHTPGLKIVYPSNPREAKQLLLAAIEDPNPVLFFEHKALYRSLEGEVPDNYTIGELGKAKVVRTGEDLTIVTYGLGVIWCQEYLDEHGEADIELIDLRTLIPWDKEAVMKSVKKTGRLLVLNEDNETGSISAEIASWAADELFELLDAPVKRLGSLDTPIPFAKDLESNYLAKNRLAEKIEDLLSY